MKKVFTKIVGLITITTLIGGVLQPLPQAHAEESAGRKALEVSKTLTPPNIDGKLDESFWSINESLSVQVGEGPFNDSKFGVLWDNQYLYIGVEGNNNNLLANQPGNWWEQNDIEIAFDPTSHQSSPYTSDDMQIGIVYQPNTTTPEFHFGNALDGHKGKDQNKILRAINTTSTGWTAEIAVPWDMLKFDPNLQKQLGMDVGMTDRYGPSVAEQRWTYWSKYQTDNFFNDTSGFGTIKLVDSNPVSGMVDPVLLEENFDGYADGMTPLNWISDVSAGSPPFTVVKDSDGNGRISFDGNAAGKQSRIMAPVQWDNYTIEADVRFDQFLNDGRWASIMFRAPATGKTPYTQMAIKQKGTIETAYRNPDGSWYSPTPIPANGPQLSVNEDYTMKIRVFGNNVKQYLKAKTDTDFTLYGDKDLPDNVLPARGAVGFQGDQSKVSFDNLKVTRITADRLDSTVPAALEALSGAASVTSSVYYSDGITEALDASRVKLYSSDESIVKISNNQLYPLKSGTANITAVYANIESVKEVIVNPSQTGVKVVSLKGDEKGYALANVGTSLDLSNLQFQADFNDLSTGIVMGNELTWSSMSPDILFEDGKLKAQQKGVFAITGTIDGVSVGLLVVAKNKEDSDYVLYEENFDNQAEGLLPTGWSRLEGTTASKAVVKSGAFELNALGAPDNPSRVVLPSYLDRFGNYKIEADVTHLQANDHARWHSIMYRIQNNNFPYYQMAVRKDATATNGVEFAERTPANAWSILSTGSNAEAIDPAKMYHYTVKAYGNRVQQWINDQLVVDADSAVAYTKGGIGLQANGSLMKVDNIRITLQQEELPAIPNGRFVEVTEPDTRIAMAASVVTEIQSVKDLEKLDASQLPSTVIIHVDEGLKVIDSTGKQEITSLESLLEKTGERIIPAFYVKDESTVDQLVEYLSKNGWEDADVISDQGDLIKRARTAYPIIRGILDLSQENNLSKESLLDIRRQTVLSSSRIVILPQYLSAKENVAYLQERMLTVWAKETSAQKDKTITIHQLIAAGVNGIITDSPSAQWDALKVYNNNTTLVRKPYIIAHRGMPSTSPENTIESNREGLDAGADFIENDMYLSKDGHIMIHHDGTLSGTTNGTGFIENYTLEQLKQLNANKPHPEGFPDVKIPTLDEQIDLAKERGAMVMAEIKTANPDIIAAYVKLIKDKDAEATINTMSFHQNQLKLMAKLMPEMPLGLLTGGQVNESNVKKSLRDTLKLLQDLNASYNTSYSGIGKKYLEASKHRGMIVSPWTINDKNNFIYYMGLGVFGITTDYSYYASEWAASIEADKETYTLNKDETVEVSAEVETYNRKKTTVQPELILLDGEDVIEVTGSKIMAKKSGTAHALLRYTNEMDSSNKYDIYTKPITIEVLPTDVPDVESPVWVDGKLEASDVTQNGLTLTWSGAIDQVGVTSYKVYQNNKEIGRVDGNVNYFMVSGLTAGTEYSFIVQAGNQEDKWSNDGPAIGIKTLADSSTGGGGDTGNTGGTGGSVKPEQPADVIHAEAGKVDADALKKAFSAFSQVTVIFTGDKLELGAAGLLEASRKKRQTLVIAGDSASYTLPLSVVSLEALAKQLNVNVEGMSIRFTVRKFSGSDAAAVEHAVTAAGATKAAEIVGFEVAAVSTDGQSVRIPFGSTYVSQNLVLNRAVNPSRATGVQFIPETNQLRFVPTLFFTKDGITTAEIKRNGNGIYTVIENNKSFADMTQHWARTDVELLANKLVVTGVSKDRFDGDRNISRAEFATLLVRALGMDAAIASTSFSDIEAAAWYAEDVATAASAGLISGYKDGTFRPNEEITREELAAMIIRALTYIGIDMTVSAEEQGNLLNKFKDSSSIVWAKAEMAAAINGGLMNGVTSDTLGSSEHATRAQAAVMLKRFLSMAGFIN
ncbi:MAG: glycerophosphodiester phosphodiesterase family protein [Candidatus Pristimantibacillus sp.]